MAGNIEKKELAKKTGRKKLRGFSFIEVMFAVFLVTGGVYLAVDLVRKALVDSVSSRNQAIAGMLAQEGLELARNIRDTNWARNCKSFGGVKDSEPTTYSGTCPDSMVIGAGGPYCIDATSSGSVLSPCASGSLKYEEATFLYNHASGKKTPFSRQISVESDSGAGGTTVMTVTSMVTWNSSSSFPATCDIANSCVQVVEVLTEWGK